MATQIQIRRDTSSNWSSSDPVLAEGELWLETDTGDLKIGDGSTAWSSLSYFASDWGDMLKSTYDQDDNGIVDNAEALNGNADTYYLDRTNHTGTQAASTISDFDTEVSNNTDVSANTTHRSSDGSDHTYIDQDITSWSSPTFNNSNMSGNISVWTNDSWYISDITSEILWDLSDVTITSASDWEVLTYNSTSWEWENQAASWGWGTITTLDSIEYNGTVQTGVLSGYRAPQGGTISEFKATAETAPTWADMLIDLIKNGTVIATATITAGTNQATDVTTFSDSTLVEDDLIEYDVTQVGSSVAGADLTLSLKLS